MKKFPRVYAESTISRMYRKLELPEETVELLNRYFVAFSTFYEILPLKDAYDIISRQNKGMVTFEQFMAFSEIARHEEHNYYILAKDELYRDAPQEEPEEREIVHESLVEFDFEEYYEMAESQYGKPLFVPSKNELLEYCDDLYVPHTPQTDALEKFFRIKLKKDREQAWDLVGECFIVIVCGDDPLTEILDDFERMGVIMTESQLEEFLGLFNDMHNNTNMPRNRGFTPNELHKSIGGLSELKEIHFGPNITSAIANGTINPVDICREIAAGDLPDEIKIQMISEVARTTANIPKVGRNEPCPCGSGKKYKKCCGR